MKIIPSEETEGNKTTEGRTRYSLSLMGEGGKHYFKKGFVIWIQNGKSTRINDQRAVH
jgi:hypothetical protein